MFWWYNMYGGVNWSVTPRPLYPADGRKIPDVYSSPGALGERLKSELGEFPFFDFWGPKAGIRSSEWIAEAALRVFDWHSPTLTLVYLPHLDYNLQRLGPAAPVIREDLRAIDRVCGKLIEEIRRRGARVIVLSEYGMSQVDGPVHLNRALREAGLLAIKSELGLETLDAGASEAFAVADHQIAHVYVRRRVKIAEVREVLLSVEGVDRVLDEGGKKEHRLNHPRSGELVALSRPNRWFTYYYWLDDALAPDFARTVDIHRKPGYDPVELFTDPNIRSLPLKVGWILLKKKLGFRYLMDVIPLDASLVRGSHGLLPEAPRLGPVFLSSEKLPERDGILPAVSVKDLILDHLFGN
jgi:predicted AlkP superfamily pyrophosphatase or phosphodiesterase